MSEAKKTKGPASYFSSIEETYGKPVSHWFTVLTAMKVQKHMEMVSVLKTKHKMGHGHANALVSYHLAKGET
ncbi:MAG: DUF4287 domain-containing protein [Phormidesmis sp.]